MDWKSYCVRITDLVRSFITNEASAKSCRCIKKEENKSDRSKGKEREW